MINPARSTLRPPGATRRTQGKGHEHSGYVLHIPGQISRLGRADASSSGAQELRDRQGVLPRGSSHCSRPLHPQLGTRLVTFTGLTSWPLASHCYSSLHRKTHHGAKDRSWARRPGVPGAVLDLPSPTCSQEPLKQREGKSFPALTEVLPARDRKSLPSLERWRPHATQR